MGYYKIKNITNSLPKRHAKANTVQSIELGSILKESKVDLQPNGEFVLESNFLPISLHKLRTEGVITVTELDKNQYVEIVNEFAKSQSESQVAEVKVVDDLNEKKRLEKKTK